MSQKLFSISRSTKGGVPIHIPMLLFMYTLIFLLAVEFVMLFWLLSSLNTAAKQIAVKAADNANFPADDVANRCKAAVNQVQGVFPGYSGRVRADYIDAVVNNGKFAFDKTYNELQDLGGLRKHLEDMGAKRPVKFWGGSPRTVGQSQANRQYGGCYAIQNPKTRQIAYYTVVHCSGCWPVFLKFFPSDTNGTFAFGAWLEGRGTALATQSVASATTANLNQALQTTGVKPFITCSQDDCDEDGGGDQNSLLTNAAGGGTSIGKDFQPSPSRPKANQVLMGHKSNVFAIEQWPTGRGALCTRCSSCSQSHSVTKTSELYCEGANRSPQGLSRIPNTGDVDPLILVGFQYACAGLDGFGKILDAGNISGAKATDENYIGRCDNYILVKPACNKGALELNEPVGQITAFDTDQKSPCLIRREEVGSSYTASMCRVDSKTVLPWKGPYVGGPKTAESEHTTAATDPFAWKNVNFGEQSNLLGVDLTSVSGMPAQGTLSSPIDSTLPYHAVCDICNPGSPKCGQYGTCRNKSNLWEGKAVIRGQWWTNTTFYALNPVYFELECKYRRDCQERHCCWDALADGSLAPYCRGRGIVGDNKRFGRKCGAGQNSWTYIGKPNDTPSQWTANSLPRLGGFPHCSTGAVKAMLNTVGECCAPDVETADLPCGNELAPAVKLNPPDSDCIKTNDKSCLRDCSQGKKSKFCPANPPKMDGYCLADNEKYPIGGECIAGPGGGPGTWGTPAPADSPATYSMCHPNKPSTAQVCDTKGSTVVSGNTTTKSSCTTCTIAMGTPILVSLNGKEPKIINKKSCFPLNQTRADVSYNWLKGEKGLGFLAIDLNHDGKINNGSELFGTLTNDRYYPDGYTALEATADKNADGLLTAKELENILLWQDLNEDGVSQKNELSKVHELGIIELDAGLYQTQKRQKKLFKEDGSVFAVYYSPKGFKRKVNGKIVSGYTWDLTFKGESDKTCIQKNSQSYKPNFLQIALEFFRKVI